MAHHLFSCWHGDYRLRRKYGEVCACLHYLMSIIEFCIRMSLRIVRRAICTLASSVCC